MWVMGRSDLSITHTPRCQVSCGCSVGVGEDGQVISVWMWV